MVTINITQMIFHTLLFFVVVVTILYLHFKECDLDLEHSKINEVIL